MRSRYLRHSHTISDMIGFQQVGIRQVQQATREQMDEGCRSGFGFLL